MTDIDSMLARVHELDQAATNGPWGALDLGQPVGLHHATLHSPNGPRETVWDSSIDPEIGAVGSAADGELIAQYRTLAPRMAKALQTVLTCAQDMLDDHSDTSPYSKGIEDMAGTVKHIVQEALRDDHL